MPSLEDLAYQRLFTRLNEKGVIVLSAHPPSGKAYDTELIRIPAKQRHAGRYHLDLIFVVGCFLFLCELKGKTSESADDVKKLRDLVSDYTFDELISFISKRVNRTDVAWDALESAVLAIGAAESDSAIPSDFTTIIAQPQDVFAVTVGTGVADADRVRQALATVF